VKNEISIVTQAMAGNDWDFFHLRKPNFTANELNQYLHLLPISVLNKTIVHIYPNLLIENTHIYGYHTPFYFWQENKHKIQNLVSISCHKLDEITELKKEQATIQHLLFSPVFKSISKKGHLPVYTNKEIADFLKLNHFPFKIIALGGITKNRQKKVVELGFDGFAVLGNFWNDYSKR
jgi:thiamine-phosphate pyrophosphorylase